jgi:hypothetical protein
MAAEEKNLLDDVSLVHSFFQPITNPLRTRPGFFVIKNVNKKKNFSSFVTLLKKQ